MSHRNFEEIMIRGVSLKTILENHMHWLNKDVEGWEKMRANLCNVDLSFIFIPQKLSANFSGAMLINCDFSYSHLFQINFENADLKCCCFNHTHLVDATFKNANIVACDFDFANCTHSFFENAILTNVRAKNATFQQSNFDSATINSSTFTLSNFEGCKFKNAKAHDTIFSICNLLNISTENTSFDMCSLFGSYIRRYGRNKGSLNINEGELDYANIIDDLASVRGSYIEYRAGKILNESIIGYKACHTCDGSHVIVTLEIPKGAVVFSINGSKFRTNKVKVLDIDGTDSAYAFYNHMRYCVGDEITINDFDCRYNVECSTGIHFFMTKEEAIDYQMF